MNQAALRAPIEYSKVALSLAPIAGNGAQNGAGVDKTGYSSLIADVSYASSGNPTGGGLTLQLQDSPDNVTFTNYGSPVRRHDRRRRRRVARCRRHRRPPVRARRQQCRPHRRQQPRRDLGWHAPLSSAQIASPPFDRDGGETFDPKL